MEFISNTKSLIPKTHAAFIRLILSRLGVHLEPRQTNSIAMVLIRDLPTPVPNHELLIERLQSLLFHELVFPSD